MKIKQFLLLLLMLLSVGTLWAENREFDADHAAINFQALPKSYGLVHVKTLAWSHGGAFEYDHWAAGGSYIYVKRKDKNTTKTIFCYHSGNDEGEDGRAWCRFPEPNYGVFRLTNTKETTLPTGPDEEEVHPTHNSSNDNLYIEFDWVIADSLAEVEFEIWVHVRDERFIDGPDNHDYMMGSFTGPTRMQPPTIQTPVFYPQDQSGRALIATAAVPYATFQTPYWYISSMNPDTVVTKDMGGVVTVPMTDTVVPDFMLTFGLQRVQTLTLVSVMNSNKVNIPAYHRIYNFKAQEWLDTVPNRCPGYNYLTWEEKKAGHTDIFSGDRFIVERASKPNFADAVQIGAVDMFVSNEHTPKDTTIHYSFVDSAFNARRTVHPDSAYWYYRVSRATAAMWSGDTLFHKETKLEKQIHLPALVTEQPIIDTLENFSKNYAVRIHVVMLGEDLPDGLGSYWDEGAVLMLHRTIEDNNNHTVLKQQVPFLRDSIRQDKTTPRLWHAYYTDYVGQPCSNYTYSVSIDTKAAFLYLPKNEYSFTVGETTYHATPQQSIDGVALSDNHNHFSHSEVPQISEFSASKATFANRILVNWGFVSGSKVAYQLERKRPNAAQWTSIGQSPTLVSPYSDDDVLPGDEYQYRLTVVSICGTDTFRNSQTCSGAASIYGHVSGYVRLGDGTAEAGTCVAAMAGSDTIGMAYTNNKGYYLIDSINCRQPITVTIMPISAYSTYSFGTSSQGIATVSIGLDAPYHDQVNFRNNSTIRFSGRVLYSNSTVPVANAYFRVNDSIVHDRNGNTIKTATDGSFTFSVPGNTPLTIQTEMRGHTFDNHGFFQMESLTEAGKMTDTLNFSKNEDGRRMHDLTRVMLRGRIAGGKDQGLLPLGHYLSKNNLGDNLNFVMELEGDNISHLVHSTDNTLHEVDSFYTDTLNQEVHTTHMHMTESRITITVDSATGEFRACVIPTRYKVVQMNAQGYATLFNNGQTTFSLDLSAAKDTADFVHIYHAPIQVGLRQYQYGVIEQPFYGIDKVRQIEEDGSTVTLPLLTVVGDSVSYAFGYPLFSEGEYFMQIAAHEDYYYNNDLHAEHDRVMLGDHDVKVFNGLDSETSETVTRLDSTGKAMVRVRACNTTFSLTDQQALKSLSVSVLVDGDYVESANLQAFVTGSRAKQNAIENVLGTEVHLDDIIRDPYGADSYAYLEKGSSFSGNFSATYDIKAGVDMVIGFGRSFNQITGQGGEVINAFITKIDQLLAVDLPLVNKWHILEGFNYSRTTTERISTSSDPYQVGADADVFTGSELVKTLTYQEAFRILNDSMYRALAPVFAAGHAHLIREGAVISDTDTAHYYLVTGDEAVPGMQVKATFAYTQRHIMQTVIPNLLSSRNALLMVGDSTQALNRANAIGKEVYLSLVAMGDEHFGCEDPDNKKQYYAVIYPKGKETKQNLVADYNNMISQWLTLITKNEAVKIMAAMSGSDMTTTYDLSHNVTIAHNEATSWSSASGGYSEFGNNASLSPTLNGLTGPVAKGLMEGALKVFNKIKKALSKKGGQGGEGGGGEPAENDQQQPQQQENQTQTPGPSFYFKLEPVLDWSRAMDNPTSKGNTRTIGYVLSTTDGTYLSQNVYRVVNDSLTKKFNGEAGDYLSYFVGALSNSEAREYQTTFDYVYSLNGGATRCPYIPADSALCYPGQVLSKATLKIDNPVMTLDKHLVSNVPANQPAVFTLTMANETEVNPNTYTSATPNTFTLFQPASANKNGAVIMMDGMPITDGRVFALNPGDHTTKRLEVYRGQGYDFEDITLVLRNTCDANNLTKVQLAVHYIPSSCDVRISSPTDKWLMNTLSPHDTLGYYIPVVIDGFDTQWENFHHIEFQYKLTTEPDEKWVNQCSFYVDSAYMAECSGNCALIKNGRIDNIRFYGERDPMEQQYDLRAVSFTRHGSGFLTKSSPVLTGIKDTRPPQVFGLPSPADQILHFDQFIEIPFSEPIAGNYLDEDNNFSMLSYTNSSDITDGTSLDFSGSADAYALSSAGRTLNRKSFTIDLMVRPNAQKRQQVLFSHGKGEKAIRFGINDLGCLTATLGNTQLVSEDPGIINSFVRLLMVYDLSDSTVHFYMGNKELRVVSEWGNKCTIASEKSCFCLGADYNDGTPQTNFAGRMMEVRVWNKALTPAQITLTDRRRLTGYEDGLLAYYPLNEGRYSLARDLANGAHMQLHSLAWSNPDGMSLHITPKDLGGQGIRLREDALSRDENQDMTLSFWFRCDNAPTTADTMALYATGLGTARPISSGTPGTPSFFIGLEGQRLTVRYSGDSLSCGMVTDAEWHRFSMTLNRANNVGNLYLDGKLLNQFNAHRIGSITDVPYLGACHYITYDEDYQPVKHTCYPFSGYFDQFQLWEQSLSPEFQERFAEGAPTGTEMGLLVYLPMHRLIETEQGEMLLVFSPYNAVIPAGQTLPSRDSIILSDAANLVSKTEYAPVRANDKLSKLRFSWVARSTNLVINLNMQDAELNKNTVYLTLRDVKDLNGNPMVSPLSWNIYMDRNRLRWGERTLDIELPYGQDTTIATMVYNLCGVYTGYTISDNADWITPVSPQGYLAATEEQRVQLLISGALDPGEYSTIVYLTDQSGLAEPLTVNLRVYTNMPSDWKLHDSDDFNTTMSLIGQVWVHGNGGTSIDTSNDDVVAAFVGNTCIGVQKNSFRNNVSALYMTLHGNDVIKGKKIEFRLWQALTGRIYELTTSVSSITYQPNTCQGCDAPVLMYTKMANDIQTLSLQSGWNWISFNLDLPSGASLNTVFASSENISSGDQIKSMFGTYFSDYSTSFALPQWVVTNADESLTYRQAYMYRSTTGGDIQVRGAHLDDAQRCLMLETAWSSLPYLCTVTQSVKDAMADYLDYALPGEIIKSYSQFAVYTADNGWVGSLEYMRPGEGYMLYRKGKAPVKFCYVNNSMPITSPEHMPITSPEHMGIPSPEHMGIPSQATTPSSAGSLPALYNLSPITYNLTVGTSGFSSPTCMPMILSVSGIELQPGDALLVVNHNTAEPASLLLPITSPEHMGIPSQATTPSSAGSLPALYNLSPITYNLTVGVSHAAEGDVLRFCLVRNGEVIAESSTQVIYDSGSMLGGVDRPFVVSFEASAVRKVIRDNQVLILVPDASAPAIYNVLGIKLK